MIKYIGNNELKIKITLSEWYIMNNNDKNSILDIVSDLRKE
jgi:hypothetical protein